MASGLELNELQNYAASKVNQNNLLLNNVMSIISRLGSIVEEKIYGEYTIGKVVNNKDPKKLRRLQIRISGIHDSIPDSELPWAMPLEQFSAGYSVVIPDIASYVKVHTVNGDENDLRYSSKIPLATDSEKRQSEAFGEEYPDWVLLFETEMGDYCQFNRTTGEFEFVHSKGLTMNIDTEGNLTVLSAAGDINIECSENITINAEGDILVKADGSDSTLTVKANNIDLQSADGSRWIPNIIPICPFTGAPHGGVAGGFTSIKGTTIIPEVDIEEDNEPEFTSNGQVIPE